MSRHRRLTPEEEALWRKATRDVTSSRPQKHKPESIVSGSNHKPMLSQKPAHHVPHHRFTPHPPLSHEDRMASGDPRMDRRAGRGRLEIDGVLDLHGHNQTSAHAHLQRFIIEGHARGARCLLVITGKGGAESSGRGILRRRFSDWINEEALRRLIARAAPAHQRHGGSGAFYVFLKR